MSDGLELRRLECIRGRRSLFNGLDLTVPPAVLLRVQGRNGAGKTSLLRMICGLLAPAHGQVLWQGRRIDSLREEFARELVFLGHAAALKDDLSAVENLLAASVLAGQPVNTHQCVAALAEVGLRGREQAPARLLSQGQRKRVSLARLVLGSAPLWVLDEPFNALDVTATAWLVGRITAHTLRGGTVVLTSHQSVEVAASVHQQVLSL